jgi:tRNA A-37 threonylcarbamoyl transferase component Bud32
MAEFLNILNFKAFIIDIVLLQMNTIGEKQFSDRDLESIAKEIGFNNSEKLKKALGKRDKAMYTKIKQLGNKGKEGTTYLVNTQDNKEYAMKTFKPRKSSKNIIKEAELQRIASKHGICPSVIDVNTEKKFIVMDKMEKHLLEVIIEQNWILTVQQQKQIYSLFERLDEAEVFHGDANLLNYMCKGSRIYMIDFGMSKHINSSLIKKHNTATPNQILMTIGLILKLKEMNCKPCSYGYLEIKIKNDTVK